MASPSDWAHFYPSTPAESTVVSTGPGPGPAQPVHNIEGGVGKSSARRRTRASRGAPTTLLNTDPTNFRAMVQQFTGAPAGPYANITGPVIGFGPQQHHHAPVVPMGQLGPYPEAAHHQQYAVGPSLIVPGSNVTDGFGHEGLNYSVASTGGSFMTTPVTSSGFFFDGMMMGGNNRSGGYYL